MSTSTVEISFRSVRAVWKKLIRSFCPCGVFRNAARRPVRSSIECSAAPLSEAALKTDPIAEPTCSAVWASSLALVTPSWIHRDRDPSSEALVMNASNFSPAWPMASPRAGNSFDPEAYSQAGEEAQSGNGFEHAGKLVEWRPEPASFLAEHPPGLQVRDRAFDRSTNRRQRGVNSASTWRNSRPRGLRIGAMSIPARNNSCCLRHGEAASWLSAAPIVPCSDRWPRPPNMP